MTALEAIRSVDEKLHNGYSQADKLTWLGQVEGMARMMLGRCGADAPQAAVEADTVLLAPAPYQGLYCRFLEAQIHYANGELERYNNAMALWNNGLMTLRDYWCREHLPRRQVQALRLC